MRHHPSDPVKVHLSSCATGPGSWRGQEERLRHCHALSDRRHTLVDDPAEADLILLGNARQDDFGSALLSNPLLRRWPDKCFVLSDEDHPPILVRGIFASARRSLLLSRRVRSGSYSAYPEAFRNPFLEAGPTGSGAEATKGHLFSFIGRNSHPVRGRLLRMRFRDPGILIEDSSSFDLWSGHGTAVGERQRRYAEVLRASYFSLCPRGAGTGSLRLFESMRLGVAPVILADDWVPPRGPDWGSCAIFVRERDLDQLEETIARRKDEAASLGANARRAFERHFAANAYFDFVVRNCLGIRRTQWLPERLHLRLAPVLLRALRLKRSIGTGLCRQTTPKTVTP